MHNTHIHRLLLYVPYTSHVSKMHFRTTNFNNIPERMNVNVSPASASCAVNGEKTVVPALSSSSKLTSKVLEAAGSCGASSTMSVTWSCRCTVLYCTCTGMSLQTRYRRCLH